MEAGMGAAIEKLTGQAEAQDRFDYSAVEVLPLQIEAMNERFQEQKDTIKLLGLRARDAGRSEITSIDDAVSLLLPHTAYKSYPESYLREERWDRLTKWLATVSAHPIAEFDTSDIVDIDDWINRLQTMGHYVTCSSGTTGKSAILTSSPKDIAWSQVDTVQVYEWGAGVKPDHDCMMIGTGAAMSVPRNNMIGAAQQAAWGNPDWQNWNYPVPPITIGGMTRQIVMRKKIADGTARPDEIAEFERTARERQAAIDAAIPLTVDYIVANREKRFMVRGFWAALYTIAAALRERGYGGNDFNPDNIIYVGGGLKGAVLPADFREVVYETFNIAPGRHFQMYGMQETNSGMPKCRDNGRYHVPPWVIPIVLDREGDNALPHDFRGEVEGRAGFVDVSVDGRWGGVISGDQITISYDPCPHCGNAGPSIQDNIARIKDLAGDDKIGCAGTVDAYVRGVA
jgi:hypothetical protein